MNKKNIVLVTYIYFPTVGGVTTYVDKMGRFLEEMENINVELLCPIKASDYDKLNWDQINSLPYKVEFFIIEGIEGKSSNVISGLFRKFSYNKAKERMLNYIKKNYDKKDTIVHHHDLISNFFLFKALKKDGYKTILTNHTGETLFWKKLPFIGQKIIDYQFSYYDKIIGPSYELAFISKKYKNKSMYFANSIEIDKSLEKTHKKETIVFLCPRRWAPTKGVIYYLKAIKLLLEKNPDLFDKSEFLFAGNSYSDYIDYQKNCLRIVSEISSENVKLLGDVTSYDEMMSLYKNSHFTVIPSLYEAVSLSALEAGLNGSIIISTNVGGLPEIVTHGKNGFMCNPKSEEQLYKLLLECITITDEKYQAIREASYNNICKNFSYNSLMQKHVAVYDELLNNN